MSVISPKRTKIGVLLIKHVSRYNSFILYDRYIHVLEIWTNFASNADVLLNSSSNSILLNIACPSILASTKDPYSAWYTFILHRVFYQSQQTGHQPPVFTNNPVRGQGKLFPVSTRKFGLESWVRLSRLTSARSIFVPGLNMTLTHGNPHPPSCFPLWFPLEPSCTIGLMSIAFTAEKSPAQGH